MRHPTALAATLAGLLITFSPLGAQQRTPSVRLEITPLFGGGASLADLPTTYRLERTDGSWIQLDGAELDAAPAFGGSVGVRWGHRFGVEGSLVYMPTEISATADGQPLEADVDLFLASGNVSWFIPVSSPRLQPYLTAGAGAKIYDYAIADTESHADLSVNWGGGVSLQVSRLLRLRLDARDHVSWLDPEVDGLDSEAQHDAIFSAGLSFALPLSGMPARSRVGRR